MNGPKPSRILEYYLDNDLVRGAYDAYKELSKKIRRSLVGTPVYARLHYALSRETGDGNLARLLEEDYYALRREIGQ